MKFQAPSSKTSVTFWSLALGASLVRGCWCLVLRSEARNSLLCSLHLLRANLRAVIETVQVEQTMDEIKLKLVFERGAKLSRLTTRGFRADENFAVLKCDHISRFSFAEELSI